MSIEVTPVSKKEQNLFLTPAAVHVIIEEEIRRSGATLWTNLASPAIRLTGMAAAERTRVQCRFPKSHRSPTSRIQWLRRRLKGDRGQAQCVRENHVAILIPALNDDW